jgi:DNA polymerase I-like protein with 3'-5' exonuclease and polymerase domains
MSKVQETLLSFYDTCNRDEYKEIKSEKLDLPPPNWDDIRLAMLKIMEAKVIGIDTETTGLDVLNDGEIRLIQVATKDKTFVFDFYDYDFDQKKFICNILLNRVEAVKVFHNAMFDILMMRPYARMERSDFKIFDTQVAEKIIDCGLSRKGFGLKDVAKKYLGIEMSKEEQASNWAAKVLTREQVEYAIKDAETTLALYEPMKKKLEEMNLVKPFNIDINAIVPLAEITWTGIYLDFEEWNKLNEQFKAKYIELEAKIKSMLNNQTINLNSSSQLKDALNKLNLGIRIETTGKDFLKQIKERHPVLPLLIEFKTVSKRITGFGEKYAQYQSHLDGRIHSRYNLLGTTTGRLSCSNPNMQQIPRTKDYRTCFKGEEGNVILKADYSQNELRIAASLSEEPTMINAFKNKIDLHTITASKIFGITTEEVKKEQRTFSKTVNFGFLYSMSPEGFKEYAKTLFDIDITLDNAEIFKRKFFEAYPGLKIWHKQLERKNYSVTLGGRIRKYDKDYITGELYNTPVQGTGADILKIALYYVYQDVVLNTLTTGKMVATVHDEIVVECKEEDAEKIKKRIDAAMNKAWDKLITNVPNEVEIQVGKTWGG